MSNTRKNTGANLINEDKVKSFDEKVRKTTSIKALENVYIEALINMTRAIATFQNISKYRSKIKDSATAYNSAQRDVYTFAHIFQKVKAELEKVKKEEWQYKMKGLALPDVEKLRGELAKEQAEWSKRIDGLREAIDLMRQQANTVQGKGKPPHDFDNTDSYAEINRMISQQVVKLKDEQKAELENKARQKAMTQPTPNEYGAMPNAQLQRPRGKVSPPPVAKPMPSSTRPGYGEMPKPVLSSSAENHYVKVSEIKLNNKNKTPQPRGYGAMPNAPRPSGDREVKPVSLDTPTGYGEMPKPVLGSNKDEISQSKGYGPMPNMEKKAKPKITIGENRARAEKTNDKSELNGYGGLPEPKSNAAGPSVPEHYAGLPGTFFKKGNRSPKTETVESELSNEQKFQKALEEYKRNKK